LLDGLTKSLQDGLVDVEQKLKEPFLALLEHLAEKGEGFPNDLFAVDCLEAEDLKHVAHDLDCVLVETRT